MHIANFGISQNRVSFDLRSGETIQLIVWDLKESQHTDLEIQIQTGCAICQSFNELISHLKLNGYNAKFEDIFFNN